MADPLCRVMDANGVVDPNKKSSTDKRLVARVCLDPSTLEVNSAAVVRLSTEEIGRIQRDFDTRMLGVPSRKYGPMVLSNETLKALEQAARAGSDPLIPPDTEPLKGSAKGAAGHNPKSDETATGTPPVSKRNTSEQK